MPDEQHSGIAPEIKSGDGVKSNPASGEKNLNAQESLRLCFISNPNMVHTRRWVSWFAKRGHTVCLLADVPLKEAWQEVPVIDLSKVFYAPIVRFPIWTIWLRRYFHQWQPDILHAHRVNSAGWLAAASGFHPYVVTPWGSDVFVQPKRSRVARLLARYTLRQADLITTISQAIGEQAIQLGARADTIKRVQSGVELDIFTPGLYSPHERTEWLRRLSLPEHARLVLSPRAVHPIYNLDLIVKAIPLVRQQYPQAYFIFADYNTDPDYKRDLLDLIKVLGLDSYIRWLPSTSNRHDMADRYHFSEMVISVPSSDGGTPVSVLEAMACGKPVICSDLPALREFITDGENGLLVPVGEVSPLAEAINQLLAQPDRAGDFGHRAHKVVSEKANFDVEMQRMEDLYQQLAKSRRG